MAFLSDRKWIGKTGSLLTVTGPEFFHPLSALVSFHLNLEGLSRLARPGGLWSAEGLLACVTDFIAVLLLQRDIPNKATSVRERLVGDLLTVSEGESVITGQEAWQPAGRQGAGAVAESSHICFTSSRQKEKLGLMWAPLTHLLQQGHTS